MPSNSPPTVDLEILPGYFIRRLQQIAVAIFLEETQEFGLTPVQYAALQAICNTPGIDQRTLSRTVGLDTSTAAGVVDRLEARGLIQRNASAVDRRVRLLTPTADALVLLEDVTAAVSRAQERMLEPLSEEERQEFMRMLKTLVTANNEVSRAPSDSV